MILVISSQFNVLFFSLNRACNIVLIFKDRKQNDDFDLMHNLINKIIQNTHFKQVRVEYVENEAVEKWTSSYTIFNTILHNTSH